MEYEIILKPEAIEDMNRLTQYHATMIADAIEVYLTKNPVLLSKSRIKSSRESKRQITA